VKLVPALIAVTLAAGVVVGTIAGVVGVAGRL